jgi:hypothetical protein
LEMAKGSVTESESALLSLLATEREMLSDSELELARVKVLELSEELLKVSGLALVASQRALAWLKESGSE